MTPDRKRVLHVLPHPGGGAEKFLSLIADLDGYEQDRVELAAARTPRAAAWSLASRYRTVAIRMAAAELVHVHGDAAALLTAPLLARTPSVWIAHGLHLTRRRPRLAPGIRLVMSRTRVSICSSQAEADELRGLAPNLSAKVRVVLNAALVPALPDQSVRAHARSGLGISEDEVVALYLGELERRKRPLDAVDAAELARAAGAPIVLLIAGRGPQEAEVASRQGSAVRVLGFRDDPQQLLGAADIFVMPSEREGMSFALLEAMGVGLAPVVSTGAGNPEAVGDAGIVVSVGDVAAFARAFTELAEDPGRRAALGNAARARVQSVLTPAKLREGIAAAWAAALGRSPSS
jgi:glycosyltransferase involved in cell wall biosynthesis